MNPWCVTNHKHLRPTIVSLKGQSTPVKICPKCGKCEFAIWPHNIKQQNKEIEMTSLSHKSYESEVSFPFPQRRS